MRLEPEPPFKPHIEKGIFDTSNISPYYINKDPTLSPANPLTQSQDEKFLNFTYVRSFSPNSPYCPRTVIAGLSESGSCDGTNAVSISH